MARANSHTALNDLGTSVHTQNDWPLLRGRQLTILRLTLRASTRWAKMARSDYSAWRTMPHDRMVATCLFKLQK